MLIGALERRDTAQVAELIATLGRIEDVAFSPSGRRLALVSFYRSTIAVMDLAVSPVPSPVPTPVPTGNAGAPAGRGRPVIELSNATAITCAAFHEPHSVAFLDEDTIVVANRAAGTVVVPAPRTPGAVEVQPLVELGDGGNRPLPLPLGRPSAVSAQAVGGGLFDVLVCANWNSETVRFVLDSSANWAIVAAERLVRDGMAVPDGVAHSADGWWVAISNHETTEVLVFRNDEWATPVTPAVGHLRGMSFPHGLSFADGDRALLVADAGGRCVHVFLADDGWEGDRQADRAVAVMDEATFQRGRYNKREGGPKGIAVDPLTGVVAVACEHQPLELFTLEQFIGPRTTPQPDVAPDRVGPNDHLRTLALWAMERLRGSQEERRLAAERAAHEEQLAAVVKRLRLLETRDAAMRRELHKLRGAPGDLSDGSAGSEGSVGSEPLPGQS